MAVLRTSLLAALREVAGNPGLNLVVRDPDGTPWAFTRDLIDSTPAEFVQMCRQMKMDTSGPFWVEEAPY